MLFLRYGFSDYSKTIVVDEKTNKFIELQIINVDFPEHDADYLYKNTCPIPEDIIFIDADNIEIHLKQMFYNLEKEEWVQTNLTAIFERIKP